MACNLSSIFPSIKLLKQLELIVQTQNYYRKAQFNQTQQIYNITPFHHFLQNSTNYLFCYLISMIELYLVHEFETENFLCYIARVQISLESLCTNLNDVVLQSTLMKFIDKSFKTLKRHQHCCSKNWRAIQRRITDKEFPNETEISQNIRGETQTGIADFCAFILYFLLYYNITILQYKMYIIHAYDSF